MSEGKKETLLEGVKRVKPILSPVTPGIIAASIPSDDGEDLPEVPAGKVLLVQLRPDGTEKPGYITVGEKTYNNVYAKKPEQWRLKKKSEKD